MANIVAMDNAKAYHFAPGTLPFLCDINQRIFLSILSLILSNSQAIGPF